MGGRGKGEATIYLLLVLSFSSAASVILKVWSPTSSISLPQGTCQKLQALGPTPDLKNQKLGGRGPAIFLHVFIDLEGEG